MSEDAGAGQAKRLSGPAYVYGPTVYQLPSESGGGEKELLPDKYILSVAKEGPIAFYEKENCRHAIGPSFFIFKKERIENEWNTEN